MKRQEIILVVEDEGSLRKALTLKLTRHGYHVLEAENGQVGLDQALKHHPDIILLDIIMPIMDGITMFHELRKDDWGKSAKVLILTNLSDHEKMAIATEKKSYGYLIKSDWKIEDLMKKVRETLDHVQNNPS